MTPEQKWERFKRYYTAFEELGLAIDISRVHFPDDYFDLAKTKELVATALAKMQELERGDYVNTTENRQVGHYWLRDPDLIRDGFPQYAQDIEETVAAIKAFAGKVHSSQVVGAHGPFKHLLVIGIGGSALGPQFVGHALGHPLTDKLALHFLDNTDPDGIDRTLARLRPELGRTLCVVISKSGGTKETRNGMLEAKAAYEDAGLDFGQHAVAVTMAGQNLERYALQHAWWPSFHIWEWVGGRTSETSAVGLLVAALQGLDIDGLLAGARACDRVTRQPEVSRNPALQLALMWYFIGRGRGEKDMVILPYKDRLELFARYLQQLVMESLGKSEGKDAEGKLVNQGIAVYGNKGSTDQHAYVQQLCAGVPNFFVVFIEVLKDRRGPSIEVEPRERPRVTSGDYLSGFLQGTRAALSGNGRQSITLTVPEVTPFSVGVLIALFERAVGFYASLVEINAYDQPGVENCKQAANDGLDIQVEVVRLLAELKDKEGPLTAEQIAARLNKPSEAERVFKLCEHLAANPFRGVTKVRGLTPTDSIYCGRASVELAHLP